MSGSRTLVAASGFLTLGLLACGGTPPPRPIVDRSALPTTDRDPLPYTPPPAAQGTTGTTVALATSGGEDQARRMLPSLIDATRDGDGRALEQILTDEVVLTRGRTQTRASPRASLIHQILLYARRGMIPADTRAEDLVDLADLQVIRAALFWRGRDAPDGVRRTDVVVEFGVLEAGRGALRSILGWNHRGFIVVRPGRDARIVAL